MRIIVITSPEFLPGEAEAVAALLDAGAWRVHVRKPGADAAGISAFLKSLPQRYRCRISLHDCLDLALRYDLGGVHLNARNPHPPSGFTGMLSRSCHSLEELSWHAGRCDYMFLSPIFDSISKPGYCSRFPMEELRRSTVCGSEAGWQRVFALGGVSPANIRQVSDAGFGGAAVLGYLWELYRCGTDIDALISRFMKLIRFNRL